MAYYDLREFIDACEKAGELTTIEKEIDWNLECGAIARRITEIGAPMAWMKKIKGCSEDWSVLASPLSKGHISDFSRVAIALGMDARSPFDEILNTIITRMKHPVRPLEVSTGPCKENILTGSDINLFTMPAPYLHEGDGGRYLDTFGVTATEDPDSAWVNWGVYRHMIHNKKILGGIVNPFQHIGMMYYQKYEARNNPMPFSIFFGGCPTSAMVGSMGIPAGVSEAEIAGGLRREPLQLVKSETNNLLVPATAELVIEGHVMPRERWDEGPFGEATGYRASPRMPRPVFRVDCVTHRNNPIMPISCPGIELDECELLFGVFSLTAAVERDLQDAGLPVVRAFSPPGMKFSLLIVSVKKGYAGIADQVAARLRGTKNGVFFGYVMVVDEDVDVTNIPEVLHAAFTRAHPVRDIQIFELAPGHALCPFLDLHDKMHARGAAMTIDGTSPLVAATGDSIAQRIAYKTNYPDVVRNRVAQALSEMNLG